MTTLARGPFFPLSDADMQTWAAKCGLPKRLRDGLFSPAPWRAETQVTRLMRAELDAGRTMLVLSGPTGVGKSVAAARFMLHMLEQRRPSLWLPARQLEALSPRKTKQLQDIEAVELLVLDDLGEEYLDEKGFLRGIVAGLLCARYDAALVTVITTNVQAVDFRERYGARLVDRIREVGAYLEVGGPSLRAAGVPRGFSPETM